MFFLYLNSSPKQITCLNIILFKSKVFQDLMLVLISLASPEVYNSLIAEREWSGPHTSLRPPDYLPPHLTRSQYTQN